MTKQENLKLKKLKDQVIVITGASSGIGLATAKMAAMRGAAVVLASRNISDLKEIENEINSKGGRALAVFADVSSEDDVRALKDAAVHRFGRIDTWVNNAAGSIWGEVLASPLPEARQIFETNFWGVHYGCQNAIEAMRTSGGSIINIGSEASERSIAFQTFYSASKHALKAYTEGLRTELERADVPVAMTLVRPAGIDTPIPQHAVNHLPKGEPALPAPVYHPDVAARAILACAETPKRDVYVGGASKLFTVLEHLIPRALDFLVERKVADDQTKGQTVPHTKEYEGLMQAPLREGAIRGGHKGHVSKTSLWTTMSLHPLASALTVAALGVAVYQFSKGSRAWNLS